MQDLPRVFLSPSAFADAGTAGGQVTLDGEAFHHLCRVLRLKEGDRLYALDGLGMLYHVTLDTVSKDRALGHVTSSEPAGGEPPVPITLAAAIPKGERWEWILQKATELGVSRILPLMTSRTVVQIDPRKAQDKQARWQKIVLEAAEQCERGRVPEVLTPMTWNAFLKSAATETSPSPLILACLERSGSPMPQVLGAAPRPEAITVLVGPEGGFSPAEAEEALALGAKGISLGSRILRAETASLAVLAMLAYQYELGN
ncbi:Ribosomal RNA small subunit methyltransferase E [compost metagenome]